jgi:hypothetical protein
LPEASAAERSLIRRCAVLTVELERLEAKFAVVSEAPATALDLYVRGCGSLHRLLQTLGLKRRQLDVTPAPSMQSYLQSLPPVEESRS